MKYPKPVNSRDSLGIQQYWNQRDQAKAGKLSQKEIADLIIENRFIDEDCKEIKPASHLRIIQADKIARKQIRNKHHEETKESKFNAFVKS